MSKTTALFTGSMNPFSLGHRYIIDASLAVFDHVQIGIGVNPDKPDNSAPFTLDQRLRVARSCVEDLGDRVAVCTYAGASIDYACEIGASALVRGLRNGTDHAYEASMTHANNLMAEHELGRLIPTFYLQCPPALMEVSATRIRELVSLQRGAEVLAHYVMTPVIELIKREIYSGTSR